MAWEARYAPDTATVMVNGSGRLSLLDMTGIAEGITRLLVKNKARRVILDCSEADLDVKVVDIFYLPECYVKLGVPRSARMALILPRTRQASGIFEFYETVCRNKGYICRLFRSYQCAEEWLGSDSATVQPNHVSEATKGYGTT